MRWFSRIAIVVGLGALYLGLPSSGRGASESVPTGVRVLFIGNSYTRFHDLPKMVEEVAASVPKGPRVMTELSFRGGVGLRTHWQRGHALGLLRGTPRRFTHVVLQGHSLSAFVRPNELVEYAERFSSEIERHGARTLLFATWAREPGSAFYRQAPYTRNFADMQEKVHRTYADIAHRLGAGLAPVGRAWQVAHERWPSIKLHGVDGTHPRRTGSYLAACVLYASLTGENPEHASYTPKGIDETTAARLREVAAEVVRGAE